MYVCMYECRRFGHAPPLPARGLENGVLRRPSTTHKTGNPKAFVITSTMTVEITFYVEEDQVFRLPMGISEVYCKLLSTLTSEQLETWVCPELERWVFTHKEFVEKAWYLFFF